MAKNTPADKEPEAAAMVKARVLAACSYGMPNDVVEVTSAEAETSPDLDAHPESVAYAESLTA